MSTFIKAAAIILITVIFTLVLPKNAKEFQVVLSLGACALVVTAIYSFLEPVVDLIESLTAKANLDGDMIRILLKATGIGLLSEYVTLICQDTGNSALGKMLQVLSSAVILWLSLPLITSLIDLIGNILTAA